MGDSNSPPATEAATGLQFISRVGNLPVVASTWNQLGNLYGYTKQSNKFVKFGLDTAESAIKIGSNIAAPVIGRLEKPVSRLDEFAVSQLDRLEHSVPIIAKPTDAIMQDANGVYEARVKPSIDRIQAATQYGVDTYNNVKNTSVNTVNGVRRYTVDTVNVARDRVNVITNSVTDTVNTGRAKVQAVSDYSREKAVVVKQYSSERVNRVLDTRYGQAVVRRVSSAVATADRYVDYYLPDTAQEQPAKEELDEASVAEDSVVNLSLKLSHRLYQRTIDTVYKYTPLDLTPLETLAVRVRTLPSSVQSGYTSLQETYDKTSARLAAIPASIRQQFDRSRQMMTNAYNNITPANVVSTVRSTAWRTAKTTTTYLQTATYNLYTIIIDKYSNANNKPELENVEMEELDKSTDEDNNEEDPDQQ